MRPSARLFHHSRELIRESILVGSSKDIGIACTRVYVSSVVYAFSICVYQLQGCLSEGVIDAHRMLQVDVYMMGCCHLKNV